MELELEFKYEFLIQSYHTKAFDFWTLKKSILNTLLQAVKAITGGVTILKGQLIKGGGALVSGLGKVVSVKGEAVTNLGRHFVNSATLVPPTKKGHNHEAIISHTSHSGESKLIRLVSERFVCIVIFRTVELWNDGTIGTLWSTLSTGNTLRGSDCSRCSLRSTTGHPGTLRISSSVDVLLRPYES
jgi:hypothetical protein